MDGDLFRGLKVTYATLTLRACIFKSVRSSELNIERREVRWSMVTVANERRGDVLWAGAEDGL